MTEGSMRSYPHRVIHGWMWECSETGGLTFPFGEGGLRSKTDEVEICYYNQIEPHPPQAVPLGLACGLGHLEVMWECAEILRYAPE